MANNIIKRTWNQNRMVNIEDLSGMAFQAENGGHSFEISGIDDSGETVALTGTVAGVFRRPDNADIALTGSASDGKAYVTLTEDCYAAPGRFSLAVFVTSGGQKVCVYAAVGTVAQTSGGAVSGSTPQDVVDLINAISAAVATIPADYSDLMAAVAPTYSNSAVYAVGSYAWYSGKLYRCISAITTAESWTASHWTLAALGTDVLSLKSIFINLNKASSFTRTSVVSPYDDLDTFPQNEIAYYVHGDAALHSPTTAAFQIICFRTYNNSSRPNTGKQQIVFTEDGNVYIRFNYGASQTWSDWFTYAKPENTIALNRASSFTRTSVVAPYDDLDTFPQNEAAYYVHGDAASNKPTEIAATDSYQLICIRTNNATSRPNTGKQQILLLDGGNVFLRSNYGPDQTWTPWYTFCTPYNAISINRKTVSASNIAAPYDDLNTVPENQVLYYIASSGVLHSPCNPLYDFQVQTIRAYGSTSNTDVGKQQILITNPAASYLTNPEIYVRSHDANTWTDWVGVKTANLSAVATYYTNILFKKYSIDSQKRLVFSGDSITYGTISYPAGVTPGANDKPYVTLIKDHFNCDVLNIGEGGAAYYSDGQVTTILQQLQTAKSQNKLYGDYLFVFAGTNDYHMGYDLDDFGDAVDDTFDYIDSNFSGTVTIIIPINRSAYSGHVSIDRPFDNYREKIYELAVKHEYNILNGADFGFPSFDTNIEFKNTIMADGIHPTVIGHKVIASKILQYIDA